MKQKWISHQDFKKKLFKSSAARREYEKLQPEFAVIQAMIEARAKKGITQKKLAVRLKTKQSVISRLETGRGNPTLSFLQRLAQAFNTRLEINFRPLAN